MKRPILPLVSCLVLVAACRGEPKSSSATAAHAPTPAEAVAERVMNTLGGRSAWDDTRCISWLFMGRRRLVWDKQTGDVRVESGDQVTFVNVHTRQGRAFVKGVEVVDEAAKASALEKAYGAFINDSYWMFMPYKLRDPGANLVLLGPRETKAGRAAEVLELTFDEVGLTPGNRYLVYVGMESGLVEQWDFYEHRADAEPRLSTPWNAWKRFGRIQLCTDHGDGKDWEIAVLDRPPSGAFEAPGPISIR